MEYTKEMHEKLRISSRGCVCAWKDEVDALLSEIDRLQSLTQWVRVEDRLPELDKKVMVTINFVDFGTGRLSRSMYYPNSPDFFETNFYNAGLVTHWMPLPLPPEGVK